MWLISKIITYFSYMLLLSHFSHVQLCATPEMAAHQAPPSLGFSRQEHWSGLPFPSPMHESEKWKWKVKVKSESEVAQLWLTLRDPMDCSPPGSSVHGILQARALEWVAIPFSSAWKWKVKVKSESEVSQSCLTLSDPMDCSSLGSSIHGIFQARVLEWGAIAFSTKKKGY